MVDLAGRPMYFLKSSGVQDVGYFASSARIFVFEPVGSSKTAHVPANVAFERLTSPYLKRYSLANIIMCGIFGIYNHSYSPDCVKTCIERLKLLQHRGKDGWGIAFGTTNRVTSTCFYGEIRDDLVPSDLKARFCISHVKYSTSGSNSRKELQPLTSNNKIAIAHNGNIPSVDGYDTQFLLDIILSHSGSIEDSLIHLINVIPVAYCLLILTEGNMYIVRDRYGIRPLSIGRLESSTYVSSETYALKGIQDISEIYPGTITRVDPTGYRIIYSYPKVQHGLCAFEYMYFMKPTSLVTVRKKRVTVEHIRQELGKTLALTDVRISKNVIVVGVPKSGLAAAKAYAEELSLTYQQLIKRKTTERGMIGHLSLTMID